jgi:subtilase family serine protease
LAGIICDENQACSMGEFTEALDTNSCCVGVCVTAADLSVTDMSVADPLLYKDTVAPITVTVENVGTVEAEAFSVSLTVQEPYTIVGVQDINSLGAGESTVLTFNFNPEDFDGLLMLLAEADSGYEITEIDETNNESELEVFVRERLPEDIEGEDFVDLMVLNAKLSANDVIVGEQVTVTASILNAGNIPSAGFTVGLYANSIFNTVLDEVTVDLLAPLDSTEVTLTLDTLEIADQSEIIVFADNKRAIVEADEENNTDSVIIYLTGEDMTVYFTESLLINETQFFTATDIAGKGLAGATVKITYPFEGRVRTESVTTDVAGIAEFKPTVDGVYSFTVSKPGYYPFFGEFTVAKEAVVPPLDLGFDSNLFFMLLAILIVGGIAYYFLVWRHRP